MVATLITISAFFYILGTYYAFRLTWSTRQTGATVLSFAVLLMTLREFFLLYNTVLLKRATDPGTELISLFISITIALGIIAIFRGHKRQKFDTEKISTLYTAKILQLSSRSALSLGTLAIFGSCVVGYYAFHTSRNAVIKREFENTYHLANHIREQSKSMWQSTPANERIERIEREDNRRGAETLRRDRQNSFVRTRPSLPRAAQGRQSYE